MKLATTMGFFYERGGMEILTPSQTVDAISATGFKQLNYSFCCKEHIAADSWKDYVLEAKETADRLGMGFCQAHAPVGDLINDEEYIGLVIRSLEACSLLGIDNAALHIKDFPGQPGAAHTREVYTANLNALQKLYPAMEKYHVTIAIENEFDLCAPSPNRRFAFSTAEEILAFIDDANHPLLGVCWDVGHANVQHLDAYESIVALGGKLKAVHISDNDGTADLHTGPFGGNMDFDRIIEALQKIKFGNCFAFEAKFMHRPPTLLKVEYNRLLYAAGKYLLEKNGCFES